MDNKDLEELASSVFERIKDGAKDIYTVGRKQAIEELPFLKKLFYFFNKDNRFLIILFCILGVVGFYWLANYFNKPNLQAGYVPANTSKPLISFENPPIPNAKNKIAISAKVEENGSIVDREIDVWQGENGDFYVHGSNYDKIKVVERNNRIDFTVRFGVAVMAIPTVNLKEAIEPAITVSPFILFDRFSIDGILNHKRGGGGISYRLPFNRFRNTFIGGGVVWPYNIDKEETSGIAYIKVNF